MNGQLPTQERQWIVEILQESEDSESELVAMAKLSADGCLVRKLWPLLFYKLPSLLPPPPSFLKGRLLFFCFSILFWCTVSFSFFLLIPPCFLSALSPWSSVSEHSTIFCTLSYLMHLTLSLPASLTSCPLFYLLSQLFLLFLPPLSFPPLLCLSAEWTNLWDPSETQPCAFHVTQPYTDKSSYGMERHFYHTYTKTGGLIISSRSFSWNGAEFDLKIFVFCIFFGWVPLICLNTWSV